MARPKKQVDERQLRELARIQCTLEEMSAVLRVSVDTLERRFADIIKAAREDGKKSVKRKLFELATKGKGNLGAVIFWGKQYCGWSDKLESQGEATVRIVDERKPVPAWTVGGTAGPT